MWPQGRLGSPEDENEEHEQHAEGGHVVHGLHEHHELAPQRGHEAHQLQHPQQPESTQHRQPAVRLPHDFPDAVARPAGRAGRGERQEGPAGGGDEGRGRREGGEAEMDTCSYARSPNRCCLTGHCSSWHPKPGALNLDSTDCPLQVYSP